MGKQNTELQNASPLVGVAIVCWNNEAILPNCLDSVRAQTYKNIKTIVLDNNSKDNSAKVIEQKYTWVQLMKSPVNTLFAKGNNIIVDEFMKDGNVKFVVLLNSDATLHPKWVETIVNFINGKKHIAFVQGLTLDFYDHDIIDSTHIFINRNGQAIQSGYRQNAKQARLMNMKVFGANAAACLVSRDFLNGQPFGYLFDEDFFMYLEDVDVAARSIVLGWDNYFVPEALAYHMGSVSSGKNPGFSVYMVNRNILPVLIKNLPLKVLLAIIPRMLVADICELYRIAKGRNFKIIKKFILGRLKGILTIPKYMGKASKIHHLAKLNNHQIWALMQDGTSRNMKN